MNKKVALLIGSESDRETINFSIDYFKYFNIDCEVYVMSAHRNPKKEAEFASNARNSGFRTIKTGSQDSHTYACG